MSSSDPDNPGGAGPVDFDRLQSACDGDAAVMRELADLYFQQAGQIMADLEKAVEASAVADVNHLAHKLAGSSLACGISAVVPSLRRLELGAKAGQLDGARESVADVGAQLLAARRLVQDYLLRYPA